MDAAVTLAQLTDTVANTVSGWTSPLCIRAHNCNSILQVQLQALPNLRQNSEVYLWVDQDACWLSNIESHERLEKSSYGQAKPTLCWIE